MTLDFLIVARKLRRRFLPNPIWMRMLSAFRFTQRAVRAVRNRPTVLLTVPVRLYRLGASRFHGSRMAARIRLLLSVPDLWRAQRVLHTEHKAVLFVTGLLRAREIKMAVALRAVGWKVVLLYLRTTPFNPGGSFDAVIRARTEADAHKYAKILGPRLTHLFAGAVDPLVETFCTDKPGPIVIDMNDVFCPSLFDYLHERFEPTRRCLELADGLCARDLQARSAKLKDGFRLPRRTIFFPEFSALDGPRAPGAAEKKDPEGIHVVSVGTFCLESEGMYDSGYLRLAELLTQQEVHFHIYPHWFYRRSQGSVFNLDQRKAFVDFYRLAERTSYLHIHESLPLDELARQLPQYDFGIVSGGCEELGQRLQMLKPEYMRTCYSGRIADYLDARLPVLINREVAFNFWLLQRQGLAVDLALILRPGFREHLLEIKRSREMRDRVERAAQRMSMNANVNRLAAFYETVISDSAFESVRLRYPLALFKYAPLLGRHIRDAETDLQRASREFARFSAEKEAKLADAGRQALENKELLRAQQKTIETLQWRLDQTLHQGVGMVNVGASTAEVAPPRRPRSVAQAKMNLELELGPHWANELTGLLNWPDIQNRAERTTGMPELMEMIRLFSAASGATSEPSSCWQILGFKNFNQLLRDGYTNFKRTIGCSYFNFLVQTGDPQISFLEENLDPEVRSRSSALSAELPDDPKFDWGDQRAYRYFVLMLWAYVLKMDRNGFMARLEEPKEGNPLLVPVDGREASQDLANSVLEYYSMTEVVDIAQCRRTLEIGGGYGRDAFVILKLNPNIQHTVVDIPPALWIAQRYLSSVFPERNVFTVRDFRSYEEVSEEMEKASIVFLLPHQLELMPDRRFDLGMNISSFGEMQQEQIAAYFRNLERVMNGHFYMKQWQVSQNAFDKLALTEENYPVPGNWQKVYSRTCRVQTAFFEALYRTG